MYKLVLNFGDGLPYYTATTILIIKGLNIYLNMCFPTESH